MFFYNKAAPTYFGKTELNHENLNHNIGEKLRVNVVREVTKFYRISAGLIFLAKECVIFFLSILFYQMTLFGLQYYIFVYVLIAGISEI